MQVPFRAWPRAPRRALGPFRDSHGGTGRCVTVGGYIDRDLWVRYDFGLVRAKQRITAAQAIRRIDGTIRADVNSKEWWSKVADQSWWDAGIVGKNGLNRCQANGFFEKPFLVVNAVDTDLVSRRKGLATRLLSTVERQTGLLPIPEIVGDRGEGDSGPASAYAFWRRFLPKSLMDELDRRHPYLTWGRQALPAIQEIAGSHLSLVAPVHRGRN
jgi:hypothetical protein